MSILVFSLAAVFALALLFVAISATRRGTGSHGNGDASGASYFDSTVGFSDSGPGADCGSSDGGGSCDGGGGSH